MMMYAVIEFAIAVAFLGGLRAAWLYGDRRNRRRLGLPPRKTADKT